MTYKVKRFQVDFLIKSADGETREIQIRQSDVCVSIQMNGLILYPDAGLEAAAQERQVAGSSCGL